MNFTYKLVEIAKEKKGITSDYAIAMLIGVSKGMISHWKIGRSEASGANLLRLIKEADVNIDQVLKMIDETENKLAIKQAGFSTVTFLIMTATASITAMAAFMSASSLYIMLN